MYLKRTRFRSLMPPVKETKVIYTPGSSCSTHSLSGWGSLCLDLMLFLVASELTTLLWAELRLLGVPEPFESTRLFKLLEAARRLGILSLNGSSEEFGMSTAVGVEGKDRKGGDLLFWVAPTGSLSAISFSCFKNEEDIKEFVSVDSIHSDKPETVATE